MENKNFSEVTINMLPLSSKHLSYQDYFMIDDNLDGTPLCRTSYDGDPVKIMFVIVMFCLKGEVRTRINLQEFRVGENDLLVIPPGSILDKVELSDDSILGQMYISDYKREYLPGSNIRMRLTTEVKYQPLLVHFRKERMRYFVDGYKMIRQIILDEDLQYKDDVMGGYMQAMSVYWLNEMDENRRNEVSQKIPRDEQIYHLFIRKVRENYTEHRDVSFYADKLNITPKYLGKVVTRVSGQRPLDWIRDHVILDAKAMILSGRYTMQEVSDALNFSNPSFFGKYFRDAVGCAPGKYSESLNR